MMMVMVVVAILMDGWCHQTAQQAGIPFYATFIRSGLLKWFWEAWGTPETPELAASSYHGDDTVFGLFNSAEVRRSECPSANGHASARALATIAARNTTPSTHRCSWEAVSWLACAVNTLPYRNIC